jgi:adenine-specific DNA-methyltransferase
MHDVYYAPDQLGQQQLALLADNIKADRDGADVLFHVLLDWGVELHLPISTRRIGRHTVYFVDNNALVACFDNGVDEQLVRELASYQPLRMVFRDSSFVNDAVKINAGQIFAQLSPLTEVRVI